MALPNAPLGFRPVRNPYGTAIPIEPLNLTTNTACYPGNILYLADTGFVSVYTGASTGRVSLIGAAVSYRAAADTDRTVHVCVSPDQEYEVQMDSLTNDVTSLTDFLGANFNGTTSMHLGNTTTLQAKGQLDDSTATTINQTTTIRPFRGVRFGRGADNDASQTGTQVVVRINDTNLAYRQNLGIL